MGVAGGASITKHLLAAREQAAASEEQNTQLQKQLAAADGAGGRRGSVPSLAKEVNRSHACIIYTYSVKLLLVGLQIIVDLNH